MGDTDLAWRERMSNAATECHELAEAVPAKVLLNDPTSMVLGHAAVFFKCMNKVERRLCAEAEMLEFLEKVYGPTKSETLEELVSPTTSTPPLASLPGFSPTLSRLRRGSSTSSCGSSMTTFKFFIRISILCIT